ncbi:MAG: OmpA family protein, partial [Bacteroidota bacterium]
DQPAEAIEDFKRGVILAPNYKVEAFLELGKLYQEVGDLTAAKEQYQAFLSRIGASDPQYEEIIDLVKRVETAEQLMAKPVPFDPQPLPGSVNSTQHHEYFPTLSVDGRRMIFTRRVFRQNEDFFETIRDAAGNWSAPTSLEQVNSDFNEAAQTVSADGRLIVFTICDKPGGVGGCDLYYTEKKGEKWTPVRNMGLNINSPAWDSHPTLSADGKLLFFSSSRPGGVGRSDLWGSARNDEGVWSPAVNLGRTLNTTGNDEFPFLHGDGQTLYFTSSGHPGMGGMDLFVVRLGADNRWNSLENLGYPINTNDNETGIFVTLDGNEAFFSRELPAEGGSPNIDIYTFGLPENARPISATYVQATVIDAVSKQPLEADVRLRVMDEDRAPRLQRTSENGSFTIVLPTGKNYALSVEQPGYLPYSSQFSLEGSNAPDDPYRLTIELQPTDQNILPDAPIVLRNVLFASGSAKLLEVSFPELDRLANLLTSTPRLKIEIGGHTDDVGSDSDNQQLSEARAKAVYNYLLEKEISANRLSFVGYGESRPIADNTTSAGRTENRRTEFRIIK